MLNVAELVPEKKSAARHLDKHRTQEWLTQQIARAKHEPVAEVVTLTPMLARLLLDRNDENRPISALAVDRYKRDLTTGLWEFNGEKIVVSKEGHLNDGQHRCLAVVETGRAMKVVMVFGADRDSRMTLDQGVSRTAAHYVGMNGHADATAVATVAAWIWQYREKGILTSRGRDRPTKSEILFTANHYADIAESLSAVSSKDVAPIGTRALVAFCHWAIAQAAGSIEATAFINKLINGDGLRQGNAILYARKRLLQMRGQRGISANDRAEIIFKAWNSYRVGSTQDFFRITGGPLPKLEA